MPTAPVTQQPDPDELGGVALFFDVENILLGIQGDFDVAAVTRFLGERGEVMTLRAYADWGRYRRQQRTFLEEGVQMVFLPTYGQSDKNRTDTAICVDAMELLFTRPLIDTFCIVSGDSDFSILAQRLRDHGKRVIGMSARSAASPILVKQCHEFVFYETLVGQRVAGFSVEEGEDRVKKALEKVLEEVGPEFRAGVLKDRMRKQDPTFSERNYGAASFTRFLANYDHLLTVGDGGMVTVVTDGLQRALAREHKGHARSEDRREKEARAVLMRTALEAAVRHGHHPIPLSRLKDTMQAVAPDFDELALGFKSFTKFLLQFPDILVVDRASNTARPNDGILPPPSASPDKPAEQAPAPGVDRRRKPRKGRDALADTLEEGPPAAPSPAAPKNEPAPARAPLDVAAPLEVPAPTPALASLPAPSPTPAAPAPAASAGPPEPPLVPEPEEVDTRPAREPRESRPKTIPKPAGLPGLDP
jgi:uncharacterized LabA/DUF88 family protein